MLALTALALVPRFLLGLLVVDFTWRAETKSRVLELFMAGPIGVGISSLLGFLWIWMRLDLRVYAALETTAIVLAAAVWGWKHRVGIRAALRSLRDVRLPRGLGWWLCLGAVALIFAWQFWVVSLRNPHGSWDAWVHWDVVSRFIYRGGEAWQGTFLRFRGEADYPLLLAITNATTWELLGTETTRGPMVLAFFATISLVGLLFGLVRDLRGAPQACLAAIVVLSQPLLVSTGTSQYADVPEACYLLASACMLVLYLRSGDRSLALLGGITAGLAAWAKNEGLVFAATAFLIWAFVSWRERRWLVSTFVLGATGPLTVLALYKAFLAPRSAIFISPADMLAAFEDPGRYLLVLRVAATSFLRATADSPLLLVVLAVYALLMGRARPGVAGLPHLLFLFGVQVAAYLLLYVGTPYAYGSTAMIPTSAGRLYMQVLPLLLAAAFLWLRSPQDADSRALAEPIDPAANARDSKEPRRP